eukprot:SM000033S12391  [mRNA]  locus=s33:595668:595928:+ [translate_table: standard]
MASAGRPVAGLPPRPEASAKVVPVVESLFLGGDAAILRRNLAISRHKYKDWRVVEVDTDGVKKLTFVPVPPSSPTDQEVISGSESD